MDNHDEQEKLRKLKVMIIKKRLQFQESRDLFQANLALYKYGDLLAKLPVDHKAYDRFEKKHYEEFGIKPFLTKEMAYHDQEGGSKDADCQGVKHVATVEFYSVHVFAQATFAQKNHAKILGSWRERQRTDGGISDVEVRVMNLSDRMEIYSNTPSYKIPVT